MSGLLLQRCQLLDGSTVDVRIGDGTITDVGDGITARNEQVIDAGSALLIPGLHDHHIHLLSLAAALSSVQCGPPAVRSERDLIDAFARPAPVGEWMRGVGYHESVAGALDRWALDRLVRDRPVRIQHRSGALWMLNSAALRATGLTEEYPDGRLFRADAHLRSRLPESTIDLAPVGRLLIAAGVTGVTDATPDLDAGALGALDVAAIPQQITIMGGMAGQGSTLRTGPHKIVLDEARGLDPIGLLHDIERAHNRDRAVAIHCVTIAEVLTAIDAIAEAGAHHGDRLEHASELPRDVDRRLRELGITVVTQPNFVAERGDEYLAEVSKETHEILYRCGTLASAGIAVAAGTDAPYGCPDPWAAMRAAVDRRTHSGGRLGEHERVSPARALHLFLGPATDPGHAPRAIEPGAPADLCLLHEPLDRVLDLLDRSLVRLTVIAGTVYGT